MPTRIMRTILLTAAGLGAAACSPTPHEIKTFLNATEHISQGSGYRLAPPDRITVFAPKAPEIDATVSVRADGTVHLRLLGDVRVAGLTAREAAAKLQKELETYYSDPVVHVSVNQYASKVFYVFGEVANFGGAGGTADRGAVNLPVTGRDTILSVLTRYPPTQNAWMSQVKVIRPSADPEQIQEMIIDFERMVTEGDLTQNILLQEGDIVYVPPTPLAWVGYRIREVLQPVAPVIDAYTTPAAFSDAADEYNDDDDGESSNLLRNFRFP